MIDQPCCPETENNDDLRAGLDKSTLKVVLFQRYNISSIYWLSAAYKINIVLQYFHIKFTLIRTPIGAAQLPNRSYFVPTNHGRGEPAQQSRLSYLHSVSRQF